MLEVSLAKGTTKATRDSISKHPVGCFILSELMTLRHVAHECARLDVKCNYIQVKLGKVNMTHDYNCQTVPSSRSFHYVQSVSHSNNVLLKTRKFSCFVINVLMIFHKGIVNHNHMCYPRLY